MHVVSHRVTSWVEDEALCFAIILDVDIFKGCGQTPLAEWKCLCACGKLFLEGCFSLRYRKCPSKVCAGTPRSVLGWVTEQELKKSLLPDGMGLLLDLGYIRKAAGGVANIFDGKTHYTIVATEFGQEQH